MRITVRAKPGSRKDLVYRDDNAAAPVTLVVRVRARAVDHAANRAVVRAVAGALGLRPRQVTLALGTRSRTKVLDVDAEPQDVIAAVEALPVEPSA